jgi:hypothetical protein
MDADGGNEVKITTNADWHIEHVAAWFERKYVVMNYFSRPSEGGMSSKIVLFDLEKGTEQELVPEFQMAGNGGVDWDRDGYIYFSGIDRQPHAKPASRAVDGLDLKRLSDPGPISVVPDWRGSKILHLLMTDRESPPFFSIVVMDESGKNPRRVKKDANIAKWIPARQ